MNISREYLGKTKRNESVYRYQLKNSDGSFVTLMNLGANVMDIVVPDRYGQLSNVALGFDKLAPYLRSHDYMGDTVGRFANRIRDGRILIDGREVQLPRNGAAHHIHGGYEGFSHWVWDAEIVEGDDEASVVFSRTSPDGEEGYPGALDVRVTYTWNSAHELAIHYQASTDQPTICNLTNHSYFNLAGRGCGTVESHTLMIRSDFIMDVDGDLIPSGERIAVDNTAFDFREPASVGERLLLRNSTPLMKIPDGFDHFYLLDDREMNRPVATVWHEESGRRMDMYTNQPGFQLFTACETNIGSEEDGMHYGKYSGICLEAQDCPNAPNLKNRTCRSYLYPGEVYDRKTVYAFSVM